MPRRKTFSPDIVAKWPEVFKDIDIKAIPLQYLDSVSVKFANGKVWDIRLNEQGKADPHKQVEKSLKEMFHTYKSSIKNVDFKVDTDRLKTDIQKRTKQFMKKRK